MSVEKDIETLQGAPVIRRTLAKSDPAPVATQAKTSINTGAIIDNDSYRATLSPENATLFDEYLTIAEKLPRGLDPIGLMNAKLQYGDVYFVELASGPYIFRALSAREDKRIKEIKGLLTSAYMNHVISTCVIAPQFTLMEAESSKLAGTKNTLYEQILAYSDFPTNDTVSVKL
jgi:hypothetical protein